MSEDHLSLNKFDVAERQLREAILLFFERRDPVAIHALVAAAHEVLHAIGKRRGVKSLLKDLMPIRPEKREEWLKLLTEAQNFFKHGRTDPEAVFDFPYGVTKLWILDAVEMLLALRKSLPREAFVFRIWAYLKNPDFLTDQQTRMMHQAIAAQMGSAIDSFEGILAALHDPRLPDRYPFGGA